MPYIGDNWIDERTPEARRLNDTYTVAAEKLAAAVEFFLYSYDHPGYQNPDFLGWSVMQFDSTKRGSGHRANYVEWTPDSDTEALVTAEPPAGSGMSGQSEAYRLPAHEQRRRTETTGPFDTTEADDPTPNYDADRAADNGYPHGDAPVPEAPYPGSDVDENGDPLHPVDGPEPGSEVDPFGNPEHADPSADNADRKE